MTKKCDRLHMTIFATAMVLAGALVGSLSMDFFSGQKFDASKKIIRANGQTFVSVRNLSEEFKVELAKDNEFAVHGGKTWIPVPGNPVELVVLNEKDCGKKCDTSRQLTTLRQAVTPALLVRTVDVGGPEGKDLIAKFEIDSVPQFVLGEGIEDHKTESGKKFIEDSAEVLIIKDGEYLVDNEKAGFPVGKFLEAPKFADVDTEPKKGTGPVRVVEYTDYQCPYCKRLHDNNKELVTRLIEEGKIQYILKDFPLSFHKEAMGAHTATNCAQKIGGDEAYWIMHEKIFDTQREWSGKGPGADAHYKTLAEEMVLDGDSFAACMDDESMKEEILADQEEGQKFGVSGTPALFIGKQIMPGAIGPEAFEQAVEEEMGD